MIILALLFAALRPSLSAPTSLDGTPGVIILERQLSTPDLHTRTRATQDIVLSCLATMFACTWVAVHPNIPGPKESGYARFRRHAVTMSYALIAPELMTLWAMRQRYASGRIKHEYNTKYGMNVKDSRRYSGCGRFFYCIKDWFHSRTDEGDQPWTLAHGFFIQSGGFMLYQNGKPAFVLTFDKLKELIDGHQIDPPAVSEEDISDKSKGDFLTKLLVVFQSTWFIVQCIGRWATGLTVTEIEVVTFAFAMLNFVTYSLWWNKPQNVQAAIPILKRHDVPDIVIEPRGEEKGWLQSKIEENQDGGVDGFLGWMMLVTLLAPLKLLGGLLLPLGKMTVDNRVPKGATRVPMFYADHDMAKEYHVVVPALAISVVFGALHLIPWSSYFPSNTERMLWRISAVAIAAEPFPATVGIGLVQLTTGRRGGQVVRMVIDAFAMSLGCIAFIGMPIYVLARLTLLGLAFATLRDLPLKAKEDILWSSFVPHV